MLLAEFEIWVDPIFQTGLPGPRVPLTLLAAAALLPIVVVGRFPLPALVGMCVALLLLGVVGGRDQSAFELVLGLLVGVYAVAAYGDDGEALLGGLVTVAAGIVYSWRTWTPDDSAADVLVPFLLLAGAWAMGREVGNHRRRSAELADRAQLLERAQEREARLAVAEERARIARELHDIVGHGISLMGVQAAAARRTLAPGQDAQREALLAVERVGRDSLAEMHRLLGILRDREEPERRRTPTLADLPALVESAAESGLDVELTLEGKPDGVPAPVGLAVYRIVQEALTNVRRHAHDAAAKVAVLVESTAVRLEVTDDGPCSGDQPEDGHGLIGMRERAAAHGGTLEVGAAPGGGFLVAAVLPLETGW